MVVLVNHGKETLAMMVVGPEMSKNYFKSWYCTFYLLIICQHEDCYCSRQCDYVNVVSKI